MIGRYSWFSQQDQLDVSTVTIFYEVLLIMFKYWCIDVRCFADGIPKGLVEDQEDCESAARREFIEETGIILPMNTKLEYLPGSAVLQGKGVKKIAAYMLEGNGDEKFISSNLIDTGFRKGLPENADGKVRATYSLFV